MKWEGRSKGTVLGYKIFIFFIKNIGVRFAYFILYFVAFYYLLFSRKGSKASYYYFRKRKGYSAFKSIVSAYKNNFVFGQTIIDKVAISSGLRDKFTYEFDGIEKLRELLKRGEGGVLISAHVGNFEIAEFFFREVDLNARINIVTTDSERNEIKEYLESVMGKPNVDFIFIKEDLSHIFEINEALSNNELICFTGDRYFDNTRYLTASLLNKEAKFPAGPFLLASRLKVPVAFVYVMKESSKHYHLYTRMATAKKRDAQDLLNNYIKSIERILERYPLQWFNYFDFWDDIKNESSS